MQTIGPRILALSGLLLCIQTHASMGPVDGDVTLGRCDTAYQAARSAWTSTLDSSALTQLRDGHCSFAKLEYLRAAWATGRPSLPDFATRGSTKLHATAALVERKVAGNTTDPQWLAAFLSTYGANGLSAFRLLHAGELPTEVVAAAGVAGLADAASACEQVCRMLRTIASEPQDVPGKVKYYLEMAHPFAIARLIDLGPSVRQELLTSADTEPDALKREAQKLTAYFALRRAGDDRYSQVIASGPMSAGAKEMVRGEESFSKFRSGKVDLRSTLSRIVLKAWGW